MTLARERNGKWGILFEYRAPDGSRRRIHLVPPWPKEMSKSEAKRLAVALVAEKTKELDADYLPKQKTLGELAEEYLAWLAEGNYRRPQTVDGIRKRIRYHVIPMLGGAKATPDKAFSVEIADRANRAIDRSDLVPESKRRLAREILNFARWLMGRHRLAPSAYGLFAEALHLPKGAPPRQDARNNCWTVPEWEAFEKTFDPSDPWLLFFETEYWGALRIGEAIGLNVADVLPERPALFVSRTWSPSGHAGQTKTSNSYAPVELPPALWSRLRSSCQGRPGDSALFFPGKRTSATTVRRIFDEHIAKAGVKHITLHGLRHSQASRLLNEGVNPLDVATHLRDTPEVVLATYAHAVPGKRIMETRGPKIWDKKKDPE